MTCLFCQRRFRNTIRSFESYSIPCLFSNANLQYNLVSQIIFSLGSLFAFAKSQYNSISRIAFDPVSLSAVAKLNTIRFFTNYIHHRVSSAITDFVKFSFANVKSQYNSVSEIIFDSESLLPVQLHNIIWSSKLCSMPSLFCWCKFHNTTRSLESYSIPGLFYRCKFTN